MSSIERATPGSGATSPSRSCRFCSSLTPTGGHASSREARLLASVNHPNIGAIYGLEQAGDVGGLVLELAEGPTLAERSARGAIAIADALPIARQIADPLHASHERGSVPADCDRAQLV